MPHYPMNPLARASLFALAIAIGVGVLLLRSMRRQTHDLESMMARSQLVQPLSSHTITLINDSGYDATLETFSLGDYTRTVRSLGTIPAQGSSEITLTVGSGRYVFALTETTATYPAMMNSIVTEDRLAELGYVFRFIQDNMSFAALEASEMPAGFYDDPPTVILPESTDTPRSMP